jgi:Xaa-Pro aminopeptidase
MSLRKFGEWGINQSHTMLITEAGTETLTKTPARLQVLDAAAV